MHYHSNKEFGINTFLDYKNAFTNTDQAGIPMKMIKLSLVLQTAAEIDLIVRSM